MRWPRWRKSIDGKYWIFKCCGNIIAVLWDNPTKFLKNPKRIPASQIQPLWYPQCYCHLRWFINQILWQNTLLIVMMFTFQDWEIVWHGLMIAESASSSFPPRASRYPGWGRPPAHQLPHFYSAPQSCWNSFVCFISSMKFLFFGCLDLLDNVDQS